MIIQLSAFIRESFLQNFALVGLLTYPRFDGLPIHKVQWQGISKRCNGFTVAGLFRICT
jgi:hypothetical protein